MSPWPVGLARTVVLLLVLVVVWIAFDAGLALRRWAYDTTIQFRFRPDIKRGWEWGYRSYHDGYLDLYERAAAYEEQAGYRLHFNYGPFRLLTMTGWAAVNANDNNPETGSGVWQEAPIFSAPVLRLNTTMALFSCVGAFLTVRLWIVRMRARRGREPSGSAGSSLSGKTWADAKRVESWLLEARRFVGNVCAPFRGWGLGLLAAGLLWFNPAVLLNAHGWPLWDVWVIPFFVWAVLLVSIDRWFAAGLLIAVGTMFKGQQMIVAPWFILTAVMMGRPGSAFRWVSGFTFGFAACVAMWMLTVPYGLVAKVPHTEPHEIELRDPAAGWVNWRAVGWVVSAALLAAVMGLRHRVTRWAWRTWLPVTLAAAGTILALFLIISGGAWWWQALLGVAALGGLAWWLPRGLQGAVVALAVAAALFCCMPLFDASTAWITFGFQRGTMQFPVLQVAHAHNILGIMVGQFGFDNRQDMHYVVFSLGGWDVTLPTLFKGIYAVVLAAISAGTARMLRHNDSRWLAGAAGMWLWMFLALPQMHERYLLFASLISVVLLAIDWRYMFVTLFLSASTFFMTLRTMLDFNRRATRYNSPTGENPWPVQDLRWAREVTHETFPGMAWGVVICGALLLLVVLRRPRNDRREGLHGLEIAKDTPHLPQP